VYKYKKVDYVRVTVDGIHSIYIYIYNNNNSTINTYIFGTCSSPFEGQARFTNAHLEMICGKLEDIRKNKLRLCRQYFSCLKRTFNLCSSSLWKEIARLLNLFYNLFSRIEIANVQIILLLCIMHLCQIRSSTSVE